MKYLLVVLLGFFSMQNNIFAQLLWSDQATTSSFNTWTTTGGRWKWVANGKGNSSIYWGTRKPIKSPTVTNGTFVLTDSLIGKTHILQSPIISLLALPAPTTLYLKFNQYARRGGGGTYTFAYRTNNGAWIPTTVLTNLPNQYETARYDKAILPVSVPSGNVKIEFKLSFVGENYFWIVDDFELYQTKPSITIPLAIGTYLDQYGYAYSVDSLGHPYKKEEVVAKFKPTATATEKAAIRNEFSVSAAQCLCDTLDVWNLRYPPAKLNPKNSATPIYSTGIEEVVDGIMTRPKIKSTEPNYYQYDELLPKSPTCFPDATADLLRMPSSISNTNSQQTKVAVLDTGIDYTNAALSPYIYISPTERINKKDQNNNCLLDDVIGYNFIYQKSGSLTGNNNPNDDHSHGSHVTGIIKNNLDQLYIKTPQYACSSVNFLPIKTHDSLGIGTLFSTACGVYYAAQTGAKVINCSWGYYAQDEAHAPILRDAVLYANSKNALVVAAAGNDGILIQSPNIHFPSSYRLPNVVAVASVNTARTALSTFSNYSLIFVDVATVGESISSNGICGQTVIKSGTSMSAPVVSAIAAQKYCITPNDTAANIRSQILRLQELKVPTRILMPDKNAVLAPATKRN